MKIQSFMTFLSRRGEVIIHGLIWLYILTLLISIATGDNPFGRSLDGVSRAPIIFLLLIFAVTLTANAFWLLPRYLEKRRWGRYGLGIFFIWAFFASVWQVMSRGANDWNFPMAPMIVALAVSYAYRFTRDWIINLGLIERLKAEKATMELAFLKSQVDPHFLFNTLNSIYSLALEEQSPKTADAVSRLGTLMRYSLHDSQVEKIPITKEVDYLEKYIALQQLRLTEKSQVTFEADISALPGAEIAPLLLIPFIENAFKYGTSPSADSDVKIALLIRGRVLEFHVANRIIVQNGPGNSHGIGLENVRNRLELLYPARHDLTIDADENTYAVNLRLELEL